MGGKNAKLVRGQVRQIVKEELPTVFTMELAREIQKQLGQQVSKQLEGIAKSVSDRLDQMEARQKTIQESFVRNVLAPAQVPDSVETEAPTTSAAVVEEPATTTQS